MVDAIGSVARDVDCLKVAVDTIKDDVQAFRASNEEAQQQMQQASNTAAKLAEDVMMQAATSMELRYGPEAWGTSSSEARRQRWARRRLNPRGERTHGASGRKLLKRMPVSWKRGCVERWSGSDRVVSTPP